jgi:predicted nucleic acid-binding protein
VAAGRVILVDSDVLIAHLRGVPQARHWLRESRVETGPLHVSVVSVVELTGGMRSGERREVWRLLGSLRIEPANDAVARKAGEFMRTYRASHSAIGLGDYLIAATADVRGLRLATLNVRHFPMVKRLRPPFSVS